MNNKKRNEKHWQGKNEKNVTKRNLRKNQKVIIKIIRLTRKQILGEASFFKWKCKRYRIVKTLAKKNASRASLVAGSRD